MAQTYVASSYDGVGVKPPNLESSRSGVSWGAILAGGVTAAVVSLILLAIGAGLGLVSVSPYASDSMSLTGLAVGAVIWLVVAQWIASALGGYISGRLRTKWADPHSDEVFFRDTAHGLLAWAVATLLTVGVFASGATGLISAASTGASIAAMQTDNAYYVDQLFRGAPPEVATVAGGDTTRTESGQILSRSILGAGNDADESYLVQLVSSRTGVSPADAEQRVQQVTAAAKDAADKARKAAATAALVTAFSLLVGAFIGAVSGALGGRYRDELPEMS